MFERISDNIYIRPYMHYTDRPNIGLICGSHRALLYDAGNSSDHAALLQRELKDGQLPFPDYIALSHWHWDHSFGAHGWDVPVIAGKATNDQLRSMTGWKWDDDSMDGRAQRGEDIVFCNEMIRREYPDRSKIRIVPADIVFEDRLTLDLGDLECELIHARGPHSRDSVICHIPSEKFLFLGDSNGKDLYGLPWHFDIEHEEDFLPTTMALPYDKNLVNAYLRLLDTLDFSHCIGGHGDLMTRDELYRSLTG